MIQIFYKHVSRNRLNIIINGLIVEKTTDYVNRHWIKCKCTKLRNKVNWHHFKQLSKNHKLLIKKQFRREVTYVFVEF